MVAECNQLITPSLDSSCMTPLYENSCLHEVAAAVEGAGSPLDTAPSRGPEPHPEDTVASLRPSCRRSFPPSYPVQSHLNSTPTTPHAEDENWHPHPPRPPSSPAPLQPTASPNSYPSIPPMPPRPTTRNPGQSTHSRPPTRPPR